MGIEIAQTIQVSDVIGWVLAFIGGFIVFKLVDNMQTLIERHNVIKEIENSINIIFSTPIAKSNKSNSQANEIDNVNVRTVLHDESPWEEYVKGQTDIMIEKNQRYVQIRSEKGYKEYISTQAIHEMVVLFRRIEKLYKDSIIKPIDLADIWREILPFGASGRLGFYKTYLGESDIKPIVFVVFNTILACDKYHIENAIEYFASDFLKDESIHDAFYYNSRYTLKERLNMRRFRNIINNYKDSKR